MILTQPHSIGGFARSVGVVGIDISNMYCTTQFIPISDWYIGEYMSINNGHQQ